MEWTPHHGALEAIQSRLKAIEAYLDKQTDPAFSAMIRNHLVVVHINDGTLIKGTLQWPIATEHPVPLPSLPSVFHVHNEITGANCEVYLTEAKAVFFVRTHEGNARHDEVRFFRSSLVLDLWIQVRMPDGEVLEGRTENSVRLLTEPGFWLWPTDRVANNLLVYVPKSSVVEFHVMGCGTARHQRTVVDTASLSEVHSTT